MQIRHINSPKAGLVEHLDNATAKTLIAAGFAEHVPYKDFRERLAAESTSQTAGTVVSVSVVGTEWGFDGSCSQFRQPVIIFKRGAETTYYDAPVKDTPASIVKQFYEAIGTALTPEQIETIRIAECNERAARIAQEQAEKLGMAKYRRL
jgi:hypothetical protein